MTTKRDNAFDFVKFIAIALVVYGHSIQNCGYSRGGYFDDIVFATIYSFHMPLFMIVSGRFAKKSLSVPYIELLKKKLFQLLIPAWICYPLIRCFNLLVFEGDLHSFEWSIMITPYWFLSVLFLCYVTVRIFSAIIKDLHICAIVTVLLVCALPPYFQLSTYLPYFWIGLLVGDKIGRIPSWLAGICFCVFVILNVLWWKGEYYSLPNIYVDYQTWSLMQFDHIANLVLKLVVGFSGSISAIYTSCIIYKLVKNLIITPRLLDIGKNTLGIYLLHWGLYPYFLRVTDSSSFLSYCIVYPIVSLSVIILTMSMIHMIKKNKSISKLVIGNI